MDFAKMVLRRIVPVGTVLLLAAACASPGSTRTGVLEPAASEAKATELPASNPALERLLALFRSLGYDGIGLEYETEGTLDLLYRVFSDPRAHGRRLKLVYTGLQMSYDAPHESLTVGGLAESNAILAYIEKHVPKRPATP